MSVGTLTTLDYCTHHHLVDSLTSMYTATLIPFPTNISDGQGHYCSLILLKYLLLIHSLFLEFCVPAGVGEGPGERETGEDKSIHIYQAHTQGEVFEGFGRTPLFTC